ncbi:hypothetical protein VTN49DRAFT_1985 [Thermomyces lanuginosus]|uniref:uncharacterized protein n=1 Tax=Thermomyces lanuginosus TaxID=5541 RepID=UPI0037442FB7
MIPRKLKGPVRLLPQNGQGAPASSSSRCPPNGMDLAWGIASVVKGFSRSPHSWSTLPGEILHQRPRLSSVVCPSFLLFALPSFCPLWRLFRLLSRSVVTALDPSFSIYPPGSQPASLSLNCLSYFAQGPDIG